MIETALTWLAVGMVLGALGVWAWWHYGGHSAEVKEGTRQPVVPVPLKPDYSPVLDSIDRLRVETREAAKRRAPEPWVVEFMSGSGRRLLGRERRSDRRPTQVSYRGMDGLTGSFVQDHQKADGTWVYRRVSVER